MTRVDGKRAKSEFQLMEQFISTFGQNQLISSQIRLHSCVYSLLFTIHVLSNLNNCFSACECFFIFILFYLKPMPEYIFHLLLSVCSLFPSLLTSASPLKVISVFTLIVAHFLQLRSTEMPLKDVSQYRTQVSLDSVERGCKTCVVRIWLQPRSDEPPID